MPQKGNEPEADKGTRRTALAMSVIASFLTPFMVSAVNISLPAIGREFQAGTVALGWVASAYLLSSAAFLLPLGRLADIAGRRRIFAAGVGVFTLSTLLSGLAPSLPFLVAARAVEGFGAAMIFATSVAILTGIHPPDERGRVLGLAVSATYIGLSAGPLLGGMVTEALGWRGVFLVVLPLCLAALWLSIFVLRGEWAGGGGRFDLAGSLLYALPLMAVMHGLAGLPRRGDLLLLAAGAAGLAVFVRREAGASSPLIDLDLLRRNAPFAFSNLAALVNYSATFAVTFLLSFYLQGVMGYGPRGAGLVMAAQPVLMAAISPLAGRLSDRVEPRVVASWGMGLTAAGLAVLASLGRDSSVAHVLGGLVVLGTGFGFFSSPNTNAVMSSVDRRLYSVASSTLGTMRLVGQAASMGLTMMILSAHGAGRGSAAADGDFLPAQRTTLALFTAICALGILASLKRGYIRPAGGRGGGSASPL